MTSKINTVAFSNRFKENTKFGNPKIVGTLFHIFFIKGDSRKLFFGNYDKNKFELTKNSIFFFTPFVIFGTFRYKKENQTEINYQIKPIGFVYYWFKYFPVIAILFGNLIFYTQSVTFDNYLRLNILLLCFTAFTIFYLKFKKYKLENDFKKYFEITE
ncbi:hypothetical protein OX283_000575 [Flavobacterium sp. SUN052]|uniref:hypothetical protein n=1 Tax=Flavobacterium sp. SUN052 TaxID=3002441 RepID=UPI00237E36A0|nr:hypothetical protein [Flavobacterium sp. SUN052]MEC4003136.1 hypothetical protein [Flavobacterium sp. SUN052]